MENFVDGMIASGMYYSASEVVQDGLKLLKDKEESKTSNLAVLRAEVLHGYEQAKRGESRPLDVEGIKVEGRRRLAAIQSEK